MVTMPDKPLLTFDLDGVLCRPPFEINPGPGRGKRRDAPGKRGLLWRTEAWRYRGRKPMPGAVAGFRLLGKAFRCEILTARSEVARTLTERWLKRHFGEVPVVHMRPGWQETSAQYKARKVQELSPVAHFEDDPHTAEWLAELIPDVFLVDWPRNRWLDLPNVHRVSVLDDAIPVLNRCEAGAEGH